MLYLYLAAALAFGGLYLHDQYEGERADAAEVKATAAYARVATLEADLKASEDRRTAEIARLQAGQDRVVAQLRAAAKAKLAQVTARLRDELNDQQRTLHAQITSRGDSACTVPVGAVLFHDAAARDPAEQGGAAIPTGPGGSVDAPSGVALSTLAATVAGNYAAAREAFGACLAEVTAWRDWYPAQRALFAGE